MGKVDTKRGGTPGHHDTGMDTLETEDLMTSHIRWRHIYDDVRVRQQIGTFSPQSRLGIRSHTRGPRSARRWLKIQVRTGTSIRTCITLPAREKCASEDWNIRIQLPRMVDQAMTGQRRKYREDKSKRNRLLSEDTGHTLTGDSENDWKSD